MGSLAVTLLGFVLMLAGVVVGVWVGIWWAFIGGIVQSVVAIRAEVLATSDLAWGILKVLCAGFIGWGAFAALFVPGLLIVRRGR